MPAPQTTFVDLIGQCRHTAMHLELRDTYTPDDPVYLDWKAGHAIDAVARWPEWVELATTTIRRGVSIRRARIVSEPVTDFIRYEYELTDALNVGVGESVRWLPRKRASDLALPGNDFWLFDGRLVRFGLFSGDGVYLGDEVSEDPDVIKLCASAFEAVWERAIPHQEYRPS
ncbi:DUF6879 family protein [Nonomuraea lactucae]|uniref:DUF6879 family protein n=1 Tax=Nonomuraea lactucae TaxID=2249762 RepID=UPI000DE56FD7|nr:DUF6879 family protein [Nonomuraea lactucae]